MRLFPVMASIAALSAYPLIAQSTDPASADRGEPAAGLSGLESTVADLQDQPAEAPVQTSETPAETSGSPPPGAPEAPALSQAEAASLVAASQRGQQLIVLARAGQLATRDMLSRIPDPEAAGIAGWIAEPEGNAIEVIFYARGANGPVAAYRGSLLGGRIVSPRVFADAERTALNPIEARMAAARDATDGLERQACGGAAFNVLVIPPVTPIAPIDVYQLTPPGEQGRLPQGGHYKATIGADGAISESRSLAEGCEMLELPVAPEGQRPAPVAVRRASSSLPSEIDVFLSVQSGRVLRVIAGDPPRTFLVAGDRIRPVAS